MRIDKPSLLIIILLDILVLFCLGVLGSRVANLVNIPTPLLLVLSVVGIILAAYIAYVRQSQSSEGERAIKLPLTFPRFSLGAIWQRINPRNLNYSEDTETNITVVSFGTAFILGTIGTFFWDPGPSSPYSLFALSSIAITFIPLLVIIIKGSKKDSWGEVAFNLVGVVFLLAAAVSGGMLFGGLIMLMLRLLGIHE
jgi:hypothetical protein